LQSDNPVDYVIATGEQFSVRDFVKWTAQALGIELEFKGSGVDEIGVVVSVSDNMNEHISIGDVIVRVHPRYFRPAEVETLLGDPRKAVHDLNWMPEISARDMCIEMTQSDYSIAKKEAYMKSNS